MANQTTRTAKKVAAFLAALATGLSVSGACKAANVARQTAYDWRAADPEFAAQWDKALEQGTEALEDEAWRRATQGVERERSHYFKETLIGVDTEIKYSDGLLTMLLKARNPAKYRDQSSVELSGDPNRPIIVERVTFARDNDPI